MGLSARRDRPGVRHHITSRGAVAFCQAAFRHARKPVVVEIRGEVRRQVAESLTPCDDGPMRYFNKITALLALCAPLGFAAAITGPGADEFGREQGKNRPFKDALEGKAPPALSVDGWMNTDGEPLSWEALRGKVVVVDFWGTW